MAGALHTEQQLELPRQTSELDDCTKLCRRKPTSAEEASCFTDLPEVQKNLSRLTRALPKPHPLHESQTPFSKEYLWVKSEVLGAGAFGIVYRCRRRNEDTYRFAVKELSLSESGTHNSIKDVEREVLVMQELAKGKACHVVKFAAFYRTNEVAWIILELLPGRSLKALLPALVKFPKPDCQKIIQHAAGELIEMLSFSHAKGIAHGDLKPENIFLDLQNCHSMTHVLDWGLATRFKPGEKRILLQGTLAYLAPEVLDEWVAESRGNHPTPVRPCQADMWSVGCVLMEALTGRNPFQASWWRLGTLQQCNGIRQLQDRWGTKDAKKIVSKQVSKLPADAQTFLHGLLEVVPERRLTAREALDHPYLSQSHCT